MNWILEIVILVLVMLKDRQKYREIKNGIELNPNLRSKLPEFGDCLDLDLNCVLNPLLMEK